MTKPQEIFEILLHLLCILLLRDYYLYKSSPKLILLTKKVNFTTLNPFENYPYNFTKITHNKLVDLTDFQYLINSKICGKEKFLLMIVVSSDPANFEKRMAIRETWGFVADDAVKIVFTFGVHKNLDMAERILKESDIFGDIVQGNFMDDYRNLTYKHVMGLKWVAAYCRTARYIAKTDDDTFVHRRNLLRLLVRGLSPWGTKEFIGCLVWVGMPVLRTNDSKWFVQKHEYKPDEYPSYCSGMFIIYSQDVLPPLVEASETTKYLFVDDAFVSGILAEKARIPRTNIRFLYHDWDHNAILIEKGMQSVNEFVWGPCNVNPRHMRFMWNVTIVKENRVNKFMWFDQYY